MYTPALFGQDLFNSFFEDFTRPVRGREGRFPQAMKTDIKETESGYDLDIELPGYSKEDVKAQLKDGVLTVEASTDTEKEDKDENGRYIRRERYIGRCSRSFYVGDNVTQEDIKAKFDNGILKIMVPKIEEKLEVEQNHYIAIEG